MGKACRLTTFDNPWDPFTQFDEWLQYDVTHGYNTCALLARVVKTSDQFTEQEEAEAIENAIDEIIKHDFENIYKKVYEK